MKNLKKILMLVCILLAIVTIFPSNVKAGEISSNIEIQSAVEKDETPTTGRKLGLTIITVSVVSALAIICEVINKKVK